MGNYNFGVNEAPHKRWSVAWYNPAVLMRSARELLSSGDQIRNFDRRELFAGPFCSIDFSRAAGDFWWDFMSDSGDSGNATYTVARAMQAASLTVEADKSLAGAMPGSHTLPCGQVLVLGGDLAYPGASSEEYQYRFVEMWEAARPPAENDRRTVLAIPQNHDWFDNISTFHRHFIGNHDDHFLDANAPQERSYFAARLPHDWWLFGLDFALVGDLDRTQFESFRELIKAELKAGDSVILLYPEPYWTRPLGDAARLGYPKRYQRLEAALMEAGVRVRMRLAGDLHHYTREMASEGAGLDYDDVLITCGSGGAFLHPTHSESICSPKVMDRNRDAGVMTTDLEKRVRVGTQDGAAPAFGQRAYGERVSYPQPQDSRKLSRGNLFALFKPASWSGVFPEQVDGCNCLIRSWQRLRGIDWGCITAGNLMFSLMLGGLYWLAVYCNGFVFSASFVADGFVPGSRIDELQLHSFLILWWKALFYSPLAFGVHLVLLILCGAIAREDGFKSAFSGFVHGLLHVFAAATLFWLVSKITDNPYIKGLLLAPAGAVVGGLLFGMYFSVMAWCGCLANNAFSALGHQGYKGFLRFRIDADGTLHGYMLGTDAVPTRWKRNPDASARRPTWVEADGVSAPEWKIRDHFVLKR